MLARNSRRLSGARARLALALLLGCPAASFAAADPQLGVPGVLGVLVMAHGGTAEWNAAVEHAAEPLGVSRPLEIAFGMADPCTLRNAVARLEARGARRIVVARLFASGESWRERTEQILAVRPGAPVLAAGADPCASPHAGHDPAAMPFFRLDTSASFALTTEGLLDAPEAGDILVERARTLSRDPGREEVLILAHGPADDDENARWLEALDRRADAVRSALPFHRVEVRTLREDWPEKRRAAEAEIRSLVAAAESAGRATIVLPFRLHGFGPYAKVLEGTRYLSDGRGLLPHIGITAWLTRQVDSVSAGAFATSAEELQASAP